MNTQTKAINQLYGNVLDLGCGDGRLVDRILEQCDNYTGIDIDEKCIEIARRSYPEQKFEVMSAENMQFEDETFDCIIANFNVVDEFMNAEKCMEEIKRVLRTGGFFVFSNHNKYYYKSLFREYEVKRNGHKIIPIKLGSSETKEFYSRYFMFEEKIGGFFTAFPYWIFRKKR